MKYYGITVRVVAVLFYNGVPDQCRARDPDALRVSHRGLPLTYHRPQCTICTSSVGISWNFFHGMCSDVQVIIIVVVPSS
jgi:hypothetical protein